MGEGWMKEKVQEKLRTENRESIGLPPLLRITFSFFLSPSLLFFVLFFSRVEKQLGIAARIDLVINREGQKQPLLFRHRRHTRERSTGAKRLEY